MTRSRRALLSAAALAAAAFLFLVFTLPPPRRYVGQSSGVPGVRRGAFHVHTVRSDGTGTRDEIAQAAARAGLDFVVFTDHGNGTRQPDPPSYLSGVLCLDGVEISTFNGHYIAVGMKPSPYALGGHARDVVDDVARLGGFGVAAHPASAKEQLQWQDWSLPIDGLEWLSADSEWRDESTLRLARAFFDYLFRPPETLASVLDRPQPVLRRWDQLARERRVVGLAAADAHARIGFGRSDPYDDVVFARLPSYDAVFRTFSNHVIAPAPTGDAGRDAAALLAALREGHLFTAVEAIAWPARFTFTARTGDIIAGPGDSMPDTGDIVFEVKVGAPRNARLQIRRDGRVVKQGSAAGLTYRAPRGTAAYRAEAILPNSPGTPPIPWIVSNPVYVGLRERGSAGTPPAVASKVVYSDGDASGWRIEHDPASGGAVGITPAGGSQELAFTFTLGKDRGARSVALMTPVKGPDLAGYDRIALRLRSDRPMRLWVQVRRRGEPDRRWVRSIYVEPDAHDAVLPFADFLPADATPSTLDLSTLDSLLFVVDTIHTPPGASGNVWFDEIRLERTH
jgi:hypothetical protein